MSTLRVSPGDDARVEFRKEGSVHRLTVRGQVLDARPMLRNLTSGGPPSRRGEDKAPDIELDLAVPIFTGFNGEAIGNAAIKLSRRGGEVRQLEATGRIGRAGLQIRQAREGEQRVMRVRSEDAGGFLRFFDLYRRAVGGDLAIDAVIEGERVSGQIAMNEFRVRGEPALRRVLGEQFAQRPQPMQGVEGSSRPTVTRDAGADVAFNRLRAGFIRTPTRITIRDGVILGNEVGVSAQGSVDYGRDQIDIAGTFVPGYAVNSALSNVPILGLFLGGGGQVLACSPSTSAWAAAPRTPR